VFAQSRNLTSRFPDFQLGLIDFGATRSYSVDFMDNWYRLLSSVIAGDRAAMQKYSLEVGYLTGEEHQVRSQS
jgi:aarF domain-containing kinase